MEFRVQVREFRVQVRGLGFRVWFRVGFRVWLPTRQCQEPRAMEFRVEVRGLD